MRLWHFPEHTKHFVLHCPLHQALRNILITEISGNSRTSKFIIRQKFDTGRAGLIQVRSDRSSSFYEASEIRLNIYNWNWSETKLHDIFVQVCQLSPPNSMQHELTQLSGDLAYLYFFCNIITNDSKNISQWTLSLFDLNVWRVRWWWFRFGNGRSAIWIQYQTITANVMLSSPGSPTDGDSRFTTISWVFRDHLDSWYSQTADWNLAFKNEISKMLWQRRHFKILKCTHGKLKNNECWKSYGYGGFRTEASYSIQKDRIPRILFLALFFTL